MESEVIIPTNKYQTPVTRELLDSLPQDVAEQLLECLTTIEFVKNLISPNRPLCKDLPRDENGRAIIDITNPPIIENTDYFRQPALHFLKHGCYTFLRPNSNPNSEYRKFWDREIKRCWEGMVRPEDGAWISGYNYWFLNYQPMMINKRVGNSNKALRVEEFPYFNEGNAWRYYYLDKARNEGHHAIELAKRGASKSYSLAGIMGRNLFLGESDEAHKRIITVLTAYQKEYLSDSKDGTLSKFKPALNFCLANTPFPNLLLKNSPNEMTWQMGYKDEYGVEKGSLNQVMAVSAKDDSSKLRGKRGTILYEEMGCHIEGTEVLMYDNTLKKVEDIKNGDLLMGKDSTPRVVSGVHSGIDNMYKITLSNGDWHIVNSKHLVHFKRHSQHNNTDEYLNIPAERLFEIKDLQDCYIEKAQIEYPHKDVKVNPYLLGLWLGASADTSIATEDKEVLDWLTSNYNGYLKQSKDCNTFYLPIKNKEEYYNLFKNKHIPVDYIYNDRDTVLQVLAGLIDIGGSIKEHSTCFEITQSYDRKQILDAAKAMATNLGFICTMSTGESHYRLKISGDISIIPTKVKRKQAAESKTSRCCKDYTFKIEPYKEAKYYGFEVDKDHLFILKDGTITHNSFPNLLTLYDTTRKSVEDGDLVFAFMYLVGTSSEDDSDFNSAKTLLYNPAAYNILELKNVFDKPKQGKPTFGFFFPSYVNRAGCYNKDGISDVVKSIIQVLLARHKARNGANPQSVLRVIAEDPITPAEAIIKVKAAYFPVAALTERLQQIDLNPHAFDDVFTGKIVLNSKGEAEFMHTEETPIRKYGVSNDTPGCIEIFAHPEKIKGEIPSNRYIIGGDPTDNDQADSSSLYSVIVFDLWKDTIVAEYTGRQAFAEDNFEITRLLCMYYNAKVMFESNKKGWYAYFAKMSSTHLLALTPNYLREKQLVKYTSFGSNRFGINMNVPLKDYAYSLIRDWLNKPVQATIKEGEQTVEITTQTLYTIRNRALLEELIAYHPELNVDRISALAQVMLYREEKMVQFRGKVDNEMKSGSKARDDEFFNKNYKGNSKFCKKNPF